jgi:hypothetical protein
MAFRKPEPKRQRTHKLENKSFVLLAKKSFKIQIKAEFGGIIIELNARYIYIYISNMICFFKF